MLHIFRRHTDLSNTAQAQKEQTQHQKKSEMSLWGKVTKAIVTHSRASIFAILAGSSGAQALADEGVTSPLQTAESSAQSTQSLQRSWSHQSPHNQKLSQSLHINQAGVVSLHIKQYQTASGETIALDDTNISIEVRGNVVEAIFLYGTKRVIVATSPGQDQHQLQKIRHQLSLTQIPPSKGENPEKVPTPKLPPSPSMNDSGETTKNIQNLATSQSPIKNKSGWGFALMWSSIGAAMMFGASRLFRRKKKHQENNRDEIIQTNEGMKNQEKLDQDDRIENILTKLEAQDGEMHDSSSREKILAMHKKHAKRLEDRAQKIQNLKQDSPKNSSNFSDIMGESAREIKNNTQSGHFALQEVYNWEIGENQKDLKIFRERIIESIQRFLYASTTIFMQLSDTKDLPSPGLLSIFNRGLRPISGEILCILNMSKNPGTPQYHLPDNIRQSLEMVRLSTKEASSLITKLMIGHPGDQHNGGESIPTRERNSSKKTQTSNRSTSVSL